LLPVKFSLRPVSVASSSMIICEGGFCTVGGMVRSGRVMSSVYLAHAVCTVQSARLLTLLGTRPIWAMTPM
jgi:hypothetical protein